VARRALRRWRQQLVQITRHCGAGDHQYGTEPGKVAARDHALATAARRPARRCPDAALAVPARDCRGRRRGRMLPASGRPRGPGAARHEPLDDDMAFHGIDYYELDSLLSEEERMIRDTVREWVDDVLIPIIGDAYIERRFPKEIIPQLGELGVFGANLPEEYGCAGLNNVAYGLIMQELERGDSGIRSFASVQGALCMYPIHEFGSEEQRRNYLPKMATGEIIGCFGLTEPDYGSNPGGMITTARQDGDGWVLNGAKMWITNGSMADIAIVWAKTGDLDDTKEIRGFIVPTDSPGFSARDQKGKLSLLASDTSELVLEDVRVGGDALLPQSGGLKSPLMCLTQARYGIAFGVVGAAMACFDEAVRYAKERVMFDTVIGQKQIQQVRLAEMLTGITQGQLLCLQLGRLKDQGRMRPQQVSLAKRANCDMAANVAREARRLLGANGILIEYSAMRHMANLESVYTYEGTHDIHGLILGHDITGLPAY
jgi:glutaryl-CoA dehydrogenase